MTERSPERGSPEGPSSPVRALRSRLGRLRRRIRTLAVLQALGRFVAAVVALLAVFFVADYLLDLPIAVRRFVRLGLLDRPAGLDLVPWVVLLVLAGALAVWAARGRLGAAPLLAFLAAGLVGVAAWLAWSLGRPARRHLGDEDLALAVERRYRSLNDRLAAALDFDQELAHPQRGESEAMMRAVVAEAAAEAESLAFQQAISARRALAWTGGALAVLVVAAGLASLAQDAVGLWARRSLLLHDEAWPRRTTVLAVDVAEDGTLTPHDPARAYEVVVGRPLTVVAQAIGSVPDEVLLVDQVTEGRPLPRRLFAMSDRPGLFTLEIRDVRGGFAFVLRGGDDQDEEPRYDVEIVVPPRVLELATHITYPPYLRRDAESFEGGNVTVPEGSEVRVEIITDVPVVRARAVLPDALVEAERIADPRESNAPPASPAGSEARVAGRRFAFSLAARETVRYRVLLETASGRESDPAADTYEVRVEPDRPPTVRWVYPRGPLSATPGGRVPLLLLAEDDQAVDALTLEIRGLSEEVQQIPLRPHAVEEPGAALPDGLGATDGPFGRKEVRAYVPLELELLALRNPDGNAPAAHDRLSLRATATDSRGQRREGPWTSLDLFAPIDRERDLDTRRTLVRTAFESVLAEQRQRRQQVSELGANAGSEADRDLLRSVQFAQAKIAQDLERATGDLLDLFNAFMYDRLGAENPTERVLAVLDHHHRTTYGAAAPAEGVPEATATRTGDPVFPYAVYDELVRAWRQREIFDTGLVDRMLAVLAPSIDAAARLAPRAHATATRAAAGDAAVAEVVAAQDALIVALEDTLDRMRTWKRLNDLILRLRKIIDEQEALDQRLAPARAAPETPRRN